MQKRTNTLGSKGKQIIITVPFESINQVSLTGLDVITKTALNQNHFRQINWSRRHEFRSGSKRS
jgi:hypothetical protein